MIHVYTLHSRYSAGNVHKGYCIRHTIDTIHEDLRGTHSYIIHTHAQYYVSTQLYTFIKHVQKITMNHKYKHLFPHFTPQTKSANTRMHAMRAWPNYLAHLLLYPNLTKM